MDLSGRWQAAPADEALRRVFHDPVFDDRTWEHVQVPGHWQNVATFADYGGPLLYRRNFDMPKPLDTAQRNWLIFDGIFSQGDIWLDGHYLGDTEGWFGPHEFEVDDQLRDRSEHHLAVEVNNSPGGKGGKRRNLLGIHEGGNHMVPNGNSGGIWRSVRLETSGPVRLRTLRAICTEATPERAVITLKAVLDSVSARSVHLRTSVAGHQSGTDQPLAEGTNEVEWTMTVPSPDLWWPHRLGDQPLHDLTVEVETRTDEISDQRSLRLGFRSISLRKWIMHVNGERLHLKGINLAPIGKQHGANPGPAVAADLQLAIDAGLDLVRPFAHVAPPELYSQADELGLLIWQDLPLHGNASNSIRGKAVAQARTMVDQLGHHPSVAIWCGHVAPAADWMKAGVQTLAQRASALAGHQLPTWTKSVLDRSIKHTIQNNDGSRPVLAFSGVLPHLPRLEGTATHLWYGWRGGEERDLADFAAKMPSQVRFLCEFGAQSVPFSDSFIDRSDWPRVKWDELAENYGYEELSFQRYVPPVGHPSYESWQEATQLYQAILVRRQVETLRRLKYRPNGGFTLSFLADAQPSISASLVDHERQPKLAYQALVDGCRPVIVVADRLPARIVPGDSIALDVHVVSDLFTPLTDAVVDAKLSWNGGEHKWRFGGNIPADDVVRVGTLSWVAPVGAAGPVTLELSLSGPASATNRYTASLT